MGDAWVIDFSCSRRLVRFENTGEIRLKGSIHNLFDKFYSTDEDDWMPGRSFYLGLNTGYNGGEELAGMHIRNTLNRIGFMSHGMDSGSSKTGFGLTSGQRML